MALIRQWSGDGLAPGPVTTATNGPGDTPFSGTDGSPAIAIGGARSPRITVPDAAGTHNVRWWPLAESALTTLAVRTYITCTGTPGEAHVFRAAESGSERWSVRLRTNGRISIHSDGDFRWTSSTNTIPTDGSLVRVEATADAGTVTATVYDGHTMTVLATGSTSEAQSGADEVWFGKAAGGQTSSSLTFDDLAVADAATLIGPAVEVVPLATPVVTLGAATDPTTSGSADGAQVVTWPAVPNADSYDALIANSASPGQGDFTLVDAGVTSPYTFTGLPAGTRAYGIQAKAQQ